jgi:two-component system response regulator PilR (NtrC family)
MIQKCALIVDDEPDIRELLEITLGRMDIQTRSAANLKAARALLAEQRFDFCLTDMNLPDGNGIELVEHVQSSFPNTPIAMITAHGNMESAVEALKAGAFDFVSKPVNLNLLRQLVDAALNLEPLDTRVSAYTDEHQLLGRSDIIESLRKQVTKLARSQAPVYISGESGSGKELVARLLHRLGPHGDAPFIPVNCGAIPTELMESEFFGHVKGSFTGATADKQGLFQAANGGTLFLDEVADLPLAMQVKLLRGIQEKAIRPVGAQKETAVDVRIVSATHKDLAAEVAANRFRQDLFYRINVIELKVPSLRQRQEDIPELAEYLLRRVEKGYQPLTRISPEAMQALKLYHFPGNVRELENILERAFALCEESVIYPDDLSLSPASGVAESALSDTAAAPETTAVAIQSPPDDVDSLESYLEDIEKNVIVEALEATRWNKTAAAKKLGITFRALRYRLKKLDLE